MGHTWWHVIGPLKLYDIRWQTGHMKPCVTADSLKVLLRGRGLMRVVDGAVVCPVGAVGAVPGVVAVDPGQLAGEGREEVEQGPGDDHVVVEAHVQRDQDHRVAHACREPQRTCWFVEGPSHWLYFMLCLLKSFSGQLLKHWCMI